MRLSYFPYQSHINPVSIPYQSRIVSVSFPYRFRIVSVSFPYRSRIVSVSFPYRSRIILLSSSYCEAENNTETIRNRTNDERMRIGGTRVVHLTIIVNSYDNGKTQTNYWGGQHLLMTTKSDKPMQNMSRVLNPLPVMGEIGPRRVAVFISVAN